MQLNIDEAHENYTYIVSLRKNITSSFWQLVVELKKAREKKYWQQLGHETWSSFLAQPEIDLAQQTVDNYITVYNSFNEIGILPPAVVDISKLQAIVPYLNKDNAEELIGKAKVLSRSDLRDELKELPHVAHNSGENEWYTPPQFILEARNTMGSIDLDPASSEEANKIVKATKFFTKEQDGLKQEWKGNVWLNPPYSQPLIELFCSKLVGSYRENLIQACVLVNNATETIWFQTLLKHCSSVCFIKGRIKYLNSEGVPENTPLQGQAILYFGKNLESFEFHFSKFGIVLWKESHIRKEENS